METLLGLLLSEAGAWIAGAAGVLAGLFWIRRDAQRATEDRLRAEAAAEEQRRRRAGDAAARDAERDGADVRLRRGDF